MKIRELINGWRSQILNRIFLSISEIFSTVNYTTFAWEQLERFNFVPYNK